MTEYSYTESLYLLYARLNDLEERQRIVPIEGDKIREIVKLINRVLDLNTGLSSEEVSCHKLSKYAKN